MNRVVRRATGGLIGAVLVVTVTACSAHGDLDISNEGPDDVTVFVGDHEALTVYADGAVSLLGYGCTPAEVTIEYASGLEVVLPGPVCPDQQIVIGDDAATLRPAPDDT